MSPDSAATYRELVEVQQTMARDLSDIREAMARLEAQLAGICRQSGEASAQCMRSRKAIHDRINEQDKRCDDISERLSKITMQVRVVFGVAGAMVTILGVLNALVILGVRL